MDNPFAGVGIGFIVFAIFIFCIWALVWILIIEYAIKCANRKANKALIGIFRMLAKIAEQQGVHPTDIGNIAKHVDDI